MGKVIRLSSQSRNIEWDQNGAFLLSYKDAFLELAGKITTKAVVKAMSYEWELN